MGMRNTHDPYGSPAVLVDNMLGNSYEVVRYVAKHIEYIKHVSAHMVQVYRVNSSLSAIEGVSASLGMLDTIFENIDNILAVGVNINNVNTVADNMAMLMRIVDDLQSILDLQENMDALLDAADRMQPYVSREIAQSATVGSSVSRILVTGVNGQTFAYVRATSPEGAALTTNGGTVGWLPDGPPNLQHFGFTGSGTKEDTDLANACLAWLGERGGGTAMLSAPGTYLLANTNPYPADDYPGISEAAANWWANRRGLYIGQDNVRLRLGPGVTLKIADGADCHAVQLGQFALGSIGVPAISVNKCGLVGKGWVIDMNAANQTPATAGKDHPAGFIVNHNSGRIELCGGTIHSSTYYGVGFEGGSTDAEGGYTNCHVHDLFIYGCQADGFDAKDFLTNSAYNVIERVHVQNCGSGGGAFLSEQAGIDLRGGWTVNDCTVTYSDGYTGARVGFRGQYALDHAVSRFPSIFRNCLAITSGKFANTIGFRMSGANCEVEQCTARGFAEGFRFSAPQARLVNNRAEDCGIGARWFADVGAGWDADRSQLINTFISDCNTAWRIDTGISNARIFGGWVGNNGVNLLNNGTVKIRDVQGFQTEARMLVSVPIDSIGLKTITATHGLPFQPNNADVQVTQELGSNVSDYRLDFVRLVSVDATNVTFEVKVGLASATAGATTLARIVIEGLE